jgi:hypothetical protein
MASRNIATLAAVSPNAGLRAKMEAKLNALVDEMCRSYAYWITRTYKRNAPAIAADELATTELDRQLRDLGNQWERRFNEAAPWLAEYFATAALERVDGALAKSLSRAGISVKFTMTAHQREVYRALIADLVGLIKSIPSEHHTEVQGLVMRSVTTGRDVGTLAKDLRQRFALTKKRAALIARDQNNKATAVFNRTRQLDMGITRAQWVHSSAGKVPRPEHVSFSRGTHGPPASGPYYDTAKGAYLIGVWTWPGVEINCRCISKSVLPTMNGIVEL